MLALISFILVLVGCANWLTIGLLQFDFVAGLFGSQSNIFSRIVYVIIGVASIIITYNALKNKGKIAFNFKKLSMQKEPLAATESGEDRAKSSSAGTHASQSYKFSSEASHDNYKNLKSMQQRLDERQHKDN